MYYRWTEKATIVPPENRGKWIRTSFRKLLVKHPQYLIWVQSEYMEIKEESSTAKQIAQRKMWQLQGRMLALVSQQRLLVAELKANFPAEFDRYTSHDNVIAQFHADVTTIDMGLLLKKYRPDIFKSEPESI